MTIMSDNSQSQTREESSGQKSPDENWSISHSQIFSVKPPDLTTSPGILESWASKHFVLTLGCEVQLCKFSSQECQERYLHHPCLFIFNIGAVELYVKCYLSMNIQYIIIYIIIYNNLWILVTFCTRVCHDVTSEYISVHQQQRQITLTLESGGLFDFGDD